MTGRIPYSDAMGLRHLFTDHPASVGETYFQHLGVASGFAIRMFAGAAACFLHALFPFAFRNTGSECIASLHEKMVQHRRRAHSSPPPAAARGASAIR
jgi:hypothetical protein